MKFIISSERLNPHLKKILIPYHLMMIGSLYFISEAELSHFLIFLFAWICIGGLGVEVTFHRALSHRSVELRPFCQKLFSLFGTLGLSCSSLFWAAVHMGNHHPYADTEKDFHSPKNGLWISYLGWTNLDLQQVRMMAAGRKLLTDSFQQSLHKNYDRINLVFTLICLLLMPKIYLLCILPAQILAFHQGNIVNIFCHLRNFGYRNFETRDQSVNIRALSFVTWGLALHNNHHQAPQLGNFARRSGELDLGHWLAKPFLKPSLLHVTKPFDSVVYGPE